MKKFLIVFYITLLMISGCSTIPENIAGDFAAISPNMVNDNNIGNQVRWGGEVIAVEPKEKHTCIKVLSRPLKNDGSPNSKINSTGRFIACRAGFLDPEEYDVGRDLTITGEIVELKTEMLGEYSYTYPVVDIHNMVLWTPATERPVIIYDHYYPWGYPHYRYPYYPPHYRPPPRPPKPPRPTPLPSKTP